MKYVKNFIIAFVLVSCSSEYEKAGFSNEEDYIAFQEGSFYNKEQFYAYKEGNFINMKQFHAAKSFGLSSLSELEEKLVKENCVLTPSFGQVCDDGSNGGWDIVWKRFNGIDYQDVRNLTGCCLRDSMPLINPNSKILDMIDTLLEYEIAMANKNIDLAEIDLALDCKDTAEEPVRYMAAVKTDERMVIIRSKDTPLLSQRLFNSFIVNQEDSSKLKQVGLRVYGSDESFMTLKISTYGKWQEEQLLPAIEGGKLFQNDDYYTFTRKLNTPIGGDYPDIRVDRKTGKASRNETTKLGESNSFSCKSFDGDVKAYLKDFIKTPVTNLVELQLKPLKEQMAAELRKEEIKEERAKLETKF